MNGSHELSGEPQAATKKQELRSSQLGMRGTHDLLKTLKKGKWCREPTSTDIADPCPAFDKVGIDKSWNQGLVQRRRAKTSHAREGQAADLAVRSSPRRPSLQSISRIVQKNKSHAKGNEQTLDVCPSSRPQLERARWRRKMVKRTGARSSQRSIWRNPRYN
ncbi:hypothetical protein FOMPIDRAFT_1054200 [Fomitopsis schrenkii]|uniref:Uncharacterized protein n=1 Tax=Fomitopsis schrenkii TaxID=2126942 RepID=S8DW23_FOMSC|nr:hypothetical protein FOMPIDRAFT_1054200 [Fomitopsis schrenkii]